MEISIGGNNSYWLMMKSDFDKLIVYATVRGIRNANYIFSISIFHDRGFHKSESAYFGRKVVIIKIKIRRNPN